MKRVVLLLLGFLLWSSGCPAGSFLSIDPEISAEASFPERRIQDEAPAAAETLSLWKHRAAAFIMLVLGMAVAGIWMADIFSGKFAGKGNFFRWREGENMLWPHLVAEYLCALGLMAASLGLFFQLPWAFPLALLSLGALIYSAINSSGWVLAHPSRMTYGVPIWISLVMAVLVVILLW